MYIYFSNSISYTLSNFIFQCQSKYCELPVECKACGLTLVSAPHLARSYHHLFPLPAFNEVIIINFVSKIKDNGGNNRVRPRFFDQVGHQTINASIGNKFFSLNNVIVRLIKIMHRADKNWAHF